MNKFTRMLLSLVLALGAALPGFAQAAQSEGQATTAVCESSAPAAPGFYG